MSGEGSVQKVTKLPSFAESFPSVLTGKEQRREKCEDYTIRNISALNSHSCAKIRTLTRSPASSLSSESRGNAFKEDAQAFPGNTLGKVQDSPSKSAETTIQLSPLRPTKQEAEGQVGHSYWDTVLGPSCKKDIAGTTDENKNEKGEKPHTCRVCPMSFKKRCNLVSHVSNVHEKIRPFQCSVCTRTFARKSNCVKHAKLVHRLKREEIEVLEIHNRSN